MKNRRRCSELPSFSTEWALGSSVRVAPDGTIVSACSVVNTGQSVSLSTFAVVESKQEPAKAASMRGHQDQIEFMFLCGFRNHIRRITAQKYAPGFCSGKLRFKKSSSLRSARLQCSLAISGAGRA